MFGELEQHNVIFITDNQFVYTVLHVPVGLLKVFVLEIFIVKNFS